MDVELQYMCMKMQYDKLQKKHADDGRRLRNIGKKLTKMNEDIKRLDKSM